MLFMQGVLSSNLSSTFLLKIQDRSSRFTHSDFQAKGEHLIVGGRSACEGCQCRCKARNSPKGPGGKRGLCQSRGRCPAQHPKNGRETLVDLWGRASIPGGAWAPSSFPEHPPVPAFQRLLSLLRIFLYIHPLHSTPSSWWKGEDDPWIQKQVSYTCFPERQE